MMSTTSVPLLNLTGQYQSIKDEIDEAINRVVESQYFILGPEVEAFEKEIAVYSNCNYGIGVSSGTDALLVALMALGIGPGDEVITTTYSFFATAGCISRVGAKPVFVDIDPQTFNIDPAMIEVAITKKTKAILPVHLFGQMADMHPIMEIAGRHDLYVIEDAAQAIGSEYKGHRAGSIGHIGCFSFYPSKNLGAFGDGGMVVTDDPRLAERIDILRKHGSQPKYYHKYIGGNFRLDALQAAVLRVKLRYLDAWTEARQCNANTYRQLFHQAHLVADSKNSLTDEGLSKGDFFYVLLPHDAGCGFHIYNQFVIRTTKRDELMTYLKEHKIGCEIYYPVPLHLQTCFAGLGYRRGDLPVSEQAADQSLAIPIYPEMKVDQQRMVVSFVKRFGNKLQ